MHKTISNKVWGPDYIRLGFKNSANWTASKNPVNGAPLMIDLKHQQLSRIVTH